MTPEKKKERKMLGGFSQKPYICSMDRHLYNRTRALDIKNGLWHEQLPDLTNFVTEVRRSFALLPKIDLEVAIDVENAVGEFLAQVKDPANELIRSIYNRLDPEQLRKEGLNPDDLELSLQVFGLDFDRTWTAAVWLRCFLEKSIGRVQTKEELLREELQRMVKDLKSKHMPLADEAAQAISTVLKKSTGDNRKQQLDLSSLRFYFFTFFKAYMNGGLALDERKRSMTAIQRQWRGDHLGQKTTMPDISCATANIVVKIMVLAGLADGSRKHTAADFYNNYKLASESLIPHRAQVKTDLSMLNEFTFSKMFAEWERRHSELEAWMKSVIPGGAYESEIQTLTQKATEK